MKPLAQNTLIQNRYLIVQLIGKGGMGEVYLAVDQRLGSPVALKRTFFSDDELLGGAFEREARTLARLRHPVLPKVSDHFTENGNQFLVMEHISGDDLAKRLDATQKPFPLNWVLFWADQLLDALAYLHSNEPPILHRDIKPQNLKLTDDNNIILLDFGLSKNTASQPPSTSGGSSGSVVGYTPHYAPMEQIRGTGTTPRSDIYALSATLYQLLTNVVPPDALTRADQMLGGSPDPIQPIYMINSEVPQSISDIIVRGMAVSQEQRFATARDMQKALREAYSQMQSAMAAQTIVFESPASDAANGLSHPQTPKPETGAQTVPMGAVATPAGSAQEASGVSEAPPETAEIPDFEATIAYDSDLNGMPPPVDSLPRQADIKTEVFSADSFTAPEPAPVETTAPAIEPENDVFATSEDFAVVEEVPEEKAYAPDATVPLVTFENRDSAPEVAATQAIPGFNPMMEIESHPAVADIAPATPFEAEPSTPTLTPAWATKPTQEPKKSKGLLLGILAGIFLLGLLGVGAVVVGWYLYTQQGSAEPANIATPSPTPLSTPTVEPTPLESNVNSSTLPANTADDTLTNVTPSPTATPERGVTETTQPTPRQVNPRQTPSGTTTKPTPKPPATGKPTATPGLRGTRQIPQ